MTNLNFILEEANGSTSILTFSLLVFLTFYLYDWLHYKGHDLWTAFMVGLPPAIALASILFIEKIGTLTTRMVIWFWRLRGGDMPFTYAETIFLLAGSLVTAIGMLFMVRVLTLPRFGSWPWVTSAVLATAYLALNSIRFMMS